MAQEPDDTLGEAHTRGDPGETVPIGGDDEAAQLALIDGSPDLLSLDGLAMAAEHQAQQRRGRGRPKGAANKRNTSLFEYLEALGHRDPAVTLSMWQTADTAQLAVQLGLGTAPKMLLAVAQLQVKAAGELMPYKYAKKPQQLELPEGAGQRPVMIIGQLNGDINALVDGGFMSAGVPPVPAQRNQQVSDDDPCDKT